jgi:hypothetical protein
MTLWGHVKSACFHLKRSIIFDLTSELATQNEKWLLNHTLGVTERGTTNLLAWRRSTLGLAILCCCVVFCFQIKSVFTQKGYYEEIVELAFMNCTYNATEGSLDSTRFRTYGERVSKSAAAAAMRHVALVRVYSAAVLVVLSFFSIIAIVRALNTWDLYHRSRYLMMGAWFLAFAAPFGVSTLPTRAFVTWDMFAAQANTLVDGVATHYELDHRQAQLIAACTAVTDENNEATLEETRANVDRMCSLVSAADTSFMNFLSGGAIEAAAVNCLLAQEALEDGRVDDALALTGNTCDDILDEVEVAEGEDPDALKRLQVMIVTQEMIGKSRSGAELAISLLNALWAVQGMVPSAVAIAPALLRGSLTVKTLIPQSSIPGMFVILLPWLYCPLVWVIYNVGFQLTGTLVLFFGLLMLAFGPMSYVMVGMYMNITKPMDDIAIKSVVRKMIRLNLTLLLIALGMILYFAFGQEGEHRGVTKKAVEEFFLPGQMTSLFLGTISKYLVTTLAGVDFVTGEIASQRDFEVYLESGLDRGEKWGGMFSDNRGRQRILEMLEQRNVRLDDLCKANRNPDLVGADDYITGKTIKEKQVEMGKPKQRAMPQSLLRPELV